MHVLDIEIIIFILIHIAHFATMSGIPNHIEAYLSSSLCVCTFECMHLMIICIWMSACTSVIHRPQVFKMFCLLAWAYIIACIFIGLPKTNQVNRHASTSRYNTKISTLKDTDFAVCYFPSIWYIVHQLQSIAPEHNFAIICTEGINHRLWVN